MGEWRRFLSSGGCTRTYLDLMRWMRDGDHDEQIVPVDYALQVYAL
jgi:hypothetical protein